MLEVLKYLEYVEDKRQPWKIKHKASDCIAITLFATLANANEWTEIQAFAEANEEFLRQYLELPNGIPSHDTLGRVMAMVKPQFLQNMQLLWNEMLSTGEGEKLKKLLNIDGKTIRGNGTKEKKALHIVTAYSKEDGICFGQRAVREKENEITAIPELLRVINIKNQIITIDAMGTQTSIAEQIRRQKADYVLAVKQNQPTLYRDIADYFDDEDFLRQCSYYKTVEKARGGIEKREYWQTDDIRWLEQKKLWKGLKTIGMTRNTITKGGEKHVETRYYISSMDTNAEEFARCVRGHWAIESLHWHLDVTFREDANKTLDEQAAFNLNIMRKFALSILKTANIGKTGTSMKLKRFYVCCNPTRFLKELLAL